jgi:hypothetical protein
VGQVQGSTEDLDLGEVLNFSAITVQNVNFAGTLTEPGFVFSAGAVEDYGYRVFRSNNFSKASEGLLLTQGADTIGFGTSTGTLASGLAIENNFGNVAPPASDVFTRMSGPFTLTQQGGQYAIKGVGLQYDVSYDISPDANAENADFNGDDFVDGADLLIWQRNASLTTGATQSQGNANPGVDGAVDGADLAIWEQQYGTSPAVAAAASVPEPTAVGLFMIGGGAALIAARTRGGKKTTS